MKVSAGLSSQVKHLLSTGDLSKQQLSTLLSHSSQLKDACKKNAIPPAKLSIPKTLDAKSVAVIFNKRSTRTRVAAETSLHALGGHPLFLSPSDIQLGVNESLEDTARVVSSMSDGIFARVGAHSDIQTLAKYSTVPVINALCDLYHPTQILADLLTISEVYGVNYGSDAPLSGLTFSWVGDANNIINDTLLSLPRLGGVVKVGCPEGYQIDPIIMNQLKSQGVMDKVVFTSSPYEAVKGADVIVTDTWISMGQEDEKAKRLQDFKGFQVTEDLARKGGAKENWMFMHCLPRKAEEVDDEVFYACRRTTMSMSFMVTDYLNELVKQFNFNFKVDHLFEYKSLLELLLENPLNKFNITYKAIPTNQPIDFHYKIKDSIVGVFTVSTRYYAKDELSKVLKVLEIVVYASLSIILELKLMETYNIHILIKKRSLVRQLIDSLFKYTQPQQQTTAQNKYSKVTDKMESQVLSTSPSVKSFPAGFLIQNLAKDDQTISSNIKSALNSLLSHNSSFDGFFNHQSIPILHSTEHNHAQLSLISYYNQNDMRLIAKLLQLSEYESGYFEQYTHFTWRLDIAVFDSFAPSTPPQQSRKLPQPDDTPKQSKSHISIYPDQDHNHEYSHDHSRYSKSTIKAWIECTICKSCTPHNDLSEGAQLYSFGKYLELLLYSNSFLPSTLCDHARRCLDSNIPSKTNFVRWFDLSSKAKLIRMSLNPVNPFDIKGPKIQIKESQSNTSDEFQYPTDVERFKLKEDISDSVVRSTRKDIAIYFTTNARGCLHDLLRDYYNHIASTKKKKGSNSEPESAQMSRSNSGTAKSMSQAAATLMNISQADNGHYNANAFQQPATISGGTSPLLKQRLTPATATANRIKRLFDQQELDLLKLLKDVPPEHANDVRRKLKETSYACRARLLAFKNKFIPESYYNKNEQRKKEKEREKEKEKEKEKDKDPAATTNDSKSEDFTGQNQNQKEPSEDNLKKEIESNDYLNNPRVHAFPGSSILVREDDPSSIIAYALSWVLYENIKVFANSISRSDLYLNEMQKMKQERFNDENEDDIIPEEHHDTSNDKENEKDKDKEKSRNEKKDKDQQPSQTEVANSNCEPDSEDPAAFSNNCTDSWTYSVTRREGTSDNPGGLLNLRMLSSKRSIDSLGMLRLRSPSSRPTSMMSDASVNTNIPHPSNLSIGPSAVSSNQVERQNSNGSTASSHRMSLRNTAENSDGDAILENLMSAEQPEQAEQLDAPVAADSEKSHKRSLSASSNTSSASNTTPNARQRSPNGLSSSLPSQPIPRRVSELSQNSDSEGASGNVNEICGKSWTSEPENALNDFEQLRKREDANKAIETLKEEEEPQEDLASLKEIDTNSEPSEMMNQESNMSSSSKYVPPPPPSSANSFIDEDMSADDNYKSDSQVSTAPTLRPSLTTRASSSFSSIFALGRNKEGNLPEDQLHAQPSLSSLPNEDKRGRIISSRMDEAAANTSNIEAKEVKKSPHIKYEFGDKTKFGVTIYFAEEFDALRRKCGVSSQLIHSLSRSMSWRAEGGKTKANFSKTVDERFVIKQLTTSWTVDDKHALLEWAPAYFKHVESNKPTLLCKILGFYSIKITPPSESKSSAPIRMDLLVMENLFHSHSISTVFDLKGIEGRKCKSGGTLGDADWEKTDNISMHLIHSHSKHIIEEALKNDTQFLMDQNIMDYSFLIGVDMRRRELVVGIIDAIGAFTIAKYIESAGKHSKQAIFNPTQSTRYSKVTVLPPVEYQKRFLQAMDKYFLPCPDKWTAINITKDNNDDVDTIVSNDPHSHSHGYSHGYSRKLSNPI
ncbi:hypothetical protein E3P89_00129 [Wallemia ichthyophaga]|uniref:PIPK domain-containing protein n=1 Tax=Wallemia ichthyophaga TaxID=245174 RepID=A0A4T0HQH1_WALIC|nr:hypothetical protein E3P90_00038 [Wallemia ichthyophaga]TIB18506.1 hypothetical protein E3P93_00038 [Wallemia ichthyophaga]TIB26259.1 hypothetical protein E3P89_00129 [Wallemia ichthyophaga]TIB27512.1 hypothetical protein E3P88_00038 [Wallemia ichthyophaga]